MCGSLRDPALKGIVETLEGIPYLRQVIVSVSGPADRGDLEQVRRVFDRVANPAG